MEHVFANLPPAVSPLANPPFVSPAAVAPHPPLAAPIAAAPYHVPVHHCPPVVAGVGYYPPRRPIWGDAAFVLVLFVLLVIILRAICL